MEASRLPFYFILLDVQAMRSANAGPRHWRARWRRTRRSRGSTSGVCITRSQTPSRTDPSQRAQRCDEKQNRAAVSAPQTVARFADTERCAWFPTGLLTIFLLKKAPFVHHENSVPFFSHFIPRFLGPRLVLARGRAQEGVEGLGDRGFVNEAL